VRETSTTLRTSTLRNDVTYAVAIAAQDGLGNAGVASDIQCGTPTELEDFFELYSRYGGPGGGGFCSVSPGTGGGRSGAGASAAVLALLLGLALRRRRSCP
jgi:MYXO-CTERM domain-containing protein